MLHSLQRRISSPLEIKMLRLFEICNAIYSEMFVQKIMSAAACFIKESIFRNVYRNMTALNLDKWSLIFAKI